MLCGADRLVGFLTGKGIFPCVSAELLALIGDPIKFRHPGGGNLANGYPATILADICDAVLDARKARALQKQQEHIADRCGGSDHVGGAFLAFGSFGHGSMIAQPASGATACQLGFISN